MCGVLGLVNFGKYRDDIVDLAYIGAEELQHRGQESFGIAWSDGRRVRVEKGMGRVDQVFTEELREKIKKDKPLMVLIHVRYSTSGESEIINAQPHYLDPSGGRVAIAVNGDIPNLPQQKAALARKGESFDTKNDAEFNLRKICYFADWKVKNFLGAIREFMATTVGSYSAGLLTKEAMFVFRDPWGNRPFSEGKLDDLCVFASETCALRKIGARIERDVNPGEINTLSLTNGPERIQAVTAPRLAHCSFCEVYFARPDSCLFNDNGKRSKPAGVIRFWLGELLHELYQREADMVVNVPDSGNYATMGLAHASGLPFVLLLVRNPFIPRTFLMPGQAFRELLAHLKYSVIPELVAVILGLNPQGKKIVIRIILVDDSIVRGTTNRWLIKLITRVLEGELSKSLGVTVEVLIDLMITFPRIKSTCHFGIDIKKPRDLIAARQSVAEIRQYLGVNFLGYMTLEGLRKTIAKGDKNPEDYCYGCMTGEYPITKEALNNIV